MSKQTVKILHKTLGLIVEESFADPIQFKIFLQSIHGCLQSREDLDFFNGSNFILHIPFDILKESVIVGKPHPETLTEKMMNKSLIETL